MGHSTALLSFMGCFEPQCSQHKQEDIKIEHVTKGCYRTKAAELPRSTLEGRKCVCVQLPRRGSREKLQVAGVDSRAGDCRVGT